MQIQEDVMDIKHRIKQTKLFHAYDKRRTYREYFRRYDMLHELAEQGGAEAIISYQWKKEMPYELNLSNPHTFNEKLQWLKLNWYDKRALLCADKNLVREYVADKGLSQLLVPQLGVYDRPEDIDFSKLPERFVLKPSHDSGHTIICKDKSKFDQKEAVSQLNRYLKVDYEFMSGEWVYASKHKTIVCEKFIEDRQAGELFDYKFFCFGGEPQCVFFVTDRSNHAKCDFYDMDWQKQSFRWIYEPSGKVFPKPKQFDQMIQYAKILAADFPFARVDFYETEGKVYFGEITFFHGGGLGWFKPASQDTDFGSMIKLPSLSNPLPWDVIHPELKMKK